jgi:hypothetical protein
MRAAKNNHQQDRRSLIFDPGAGDRRRPGAEAGAVAPDLAGRSGHQHSQGKAAPDLYRAKPRATVGAHEGLHMNRISTEAAVERLWLALEWEPPIKFIEIFDAIASRLHRHPRFHGMTITEIDLLLADIRRDAEHDVGELEWRLIDAFKDAIFDVADGVAA